MLNHDSLRRAQWPLALLIFCVLWGMVRPVQAQAPFGKPGDRLAEALVFLQTNGIPDSALHDLSLTGGNAQKVADVLKNAGLSDDQITAFETPENLRTLNRTLNPNLITDFLVKLAVIVRPYDILPLEFLAFLPMADDPQKMAAALEQRHLTAAQVRSLMDQLTPVIQEAEAEGILKYAPVGAAFLAFGELGLVEQDLYNVSTILNDANGVGVYFMHRGLTDNGLQGVMGTLNLLVGQGLSTNTITGATTINAIYRLEGLGLSPRLLNDLVQLGDLEAVRARLEQEGLSGTALELGVVNLEGVLGTKGERLTPKMLVSFQAGEAATLLSSAGLDPAGLDQIFQVKDDPEALRQYLAGQGLDSAVIDAFILGLNHSTFVKTVDPDAAGDFITSVEQQMTQP